MSMCIASRFRAVSTSVSPFETLEPEGATFTVSEGQIVGLIGPNGAGKTSMIDALTGYHPPSAGIVQFRGEDVTKVKADQRSRKGLVRTFQSVELFDDLTVEENMLVAAEHVGFWQRLRGKTRPPNDH